MPVPNLDIAVFGAKRDFLEKEVAFFPNVDFTNHVALVAVIEEGGRPVIVAGGRFVVERPGVAEIAFVVIDEYQGQDIGAALLQHLVVLARGAALNNLPPKSCRRIFQC